MAKVNRSGGVVEELREIKRVMEELVEVMKKVASGLERREAAGGRVMRRKRRLGKKKIM